MSQLSDRPNTALMVIDVQKGVVADAHQRDAVVARITDSYRLRSSRAAKKGATS